MTPDEWKPTIYRAWNRRRGCFGWTCTHPRANSWTGVTLSRARRREHEAWKFCTTLNAKEKT